MVQGNGTHGAASRKVLACWDFVALLVRLAGELAVVPKNSTEDSVRAAPLASPHSEALSEPFPKNLDEKLLTDVDFGEVLLLALRLAAGRMRFFSGLFKLRNEYL